MSAGPTRRSPGFRDTIFCACAPGELPQSFLCLPQELTRASGPTYTSVLEKKPSLALNPSSESDGHPHSPPKCQPLCLPSPLRSLCVEFRLPGSSPFHLLFLSLPTSTPSPFLSFSLRQFKLTSNSQSSCGNPPNGGITVVCCQTQFASGEQNSLAFLTFLTAPHQE